MYDSISHLDKCKHTTYIKNKTVYLKGLNSLSIFQSLSNQRTWSANKEHYELSDGKFCSMVKKNITKIQIWEISFLKYTNRDQYTSKQEK